MFSYDGDFREADRRLRSESMRRKAAGLAGMLEKSENASIAKFRETVREFVETGREILTGQYTGISGFKHVMGQMIGDMAVSFKDDDEAQEILALVRYGNLACQKPLVESELLFIAKHPSIAKKLLTLTPLDP